MPHVIVKLWPGKTEDQKKQLVENITKNVCEDLGSKPESVSVSIEEVSPDNWMDQVYAPDIEKKQEQLYKRPGYGPLV